MFEREKERLFGTAATHIAQTAVNYLILHHRQLHQQRLRRLMT